MAFEAAIVPDQFIFAVTRGELLAWGHCTDIADATDWDLTTLGKQLLATQDARRAEQTRLRRLIAKLRTSRRGIRRTFYDADIVRLIKWAEGGQSVEVVAARSGLPKEQVKYMLEAMGLQYGEK